MTDTTDIEPMIPKVIVKKLEPTKKHFQDIVKISILDLLNFKEMGMPEDLYLELMEELDRRGLYKSDLIRGWVSDYKPENMNNAQLGDDWRITLGWYSAIKNGRKLYKHKGGESQEITIQDCKELALKIYKERVQRGFKFSKPETYSTNAKELFEWVISQVGEKNVPFKNAFLDPKTIQQADLEKIDPEYIKTLSDGQLGELHNRLHELYKQIGGKEPLFNAHIFVWQAMRDRKIRHDIIDDLDRKTSLVVVEYPIPEEGVPQQNAKEIINLNEVLNALPDQIIVDDPIHVYMCGRVVNEKKIPLTHDLDILFKQGFFHQPSMRSFLSAVAENNPDIAKRFHFVWDPEGPQIGYAVPLYRLAYIKVHPDEMQRKSPFQILDLAGITMFKPYIPMKPKSGFGISAFFNLDEMWKVWAIKRIDKGIMIQKKYDGMRYSIQVQGQKIKIFTEDRQRDRVECFKKSVTELLKHKKVNSFIIDAEMVEYSCGKIQSKNLEEVCIPVVREEMIKWIAANPSSLDDSGVVFHVHDCIYLDGKDINIEGYEDRWKVIDQVFPSNLEHWRRVDGTVVTSMPAFYKQVGIYRKKKGSEGVVCKDITAPYHLKYSGENRTTDMAKLKNMKEVDIKVIRVIQKKSKEGKILNQYLYDCAFSVPCGILDQFRKSDQVREGGKCYVEIGRTYATGERVSAGSVITVRPMRIAITESKEGKYVTWMFPFYSGKANKSEPNTYEDMKRIAAEGTSPGKQKLTAVINLSTCPLWNDPEVCPLMERFQTPRDNLSDIQIEYLKFPIACRFANSYRCRYVKNYYYGIRDFKINTLTDEDNLSLEGEED